MNRFILRSVVARMSQSLISSVRTHRAILEPIESRVLFSGLDGSELVGLPSDMKTSLYTFVGDHSSSNSEKWTMNVGGHVFATSTFGEVRRDLSEYKKGETYPITLNHNGSNRYVNGVNKPDYDYRAWVDSSANPAWTSGPTTVSGSTYFATETASPALLQKRWFGSDVNATLDKVALLNIPDVDLTGDSNEDGQVNLEDSKVENDVTRGPWIPASTNDADNDGEVDFSDQKIDGGSFVPLTLSLSANLAFAQPSSVTYTFDYGQANVPLNVDNASGLTNPDLGGLLYLWKKDASVQRVAGDLLTSGSSFSLSLTPGYSTTIYVQAVGAARSPNALPIKVTATVTGSVWSGTLTDTVYVRPIAFDADVDTNNDNGFSVPQQDKLEDRDEDRLLDANSKPIAGKPIVVNNGDADNDGIPDFADGFDLKTDSTLDDLSPDVKFVPVSVRIPENVDPTKATFKFDYSASNPASVVRLGDGTTASPYVYNAADGFFRIWTKDGSELRNKALANTPGGHYVAPGSSNIYTAANLGFVSGSRLGTLWIEAVRPTGDIGEGRISATLDPDGAGPASFNSTDAFRLTGINLQLAVDASGDGTIVTDSRDFTSPTKPYRFWLNDDSDVYDYSVLEYGGGATDKFGLPPDSGNTSIGSDNGTEGIASRITEVFRRDLEDFSQVGLGYSSTIALIADKIVFDIKGASNPNMSVRLWRSVPQAGAGYGYDGTSKVYRFSADGHVTNQNGMADGIQQITNNYSASNPDSFMRLYADSPIEMSVTDFQSKFGLFGPEQNRYTQLMFEGVIAGSGKVTVTFKKGDTAIATSAFDLDLHKATDLFEHYSISRSTASGPDGDWSSSNSTIDPRTTPVPTNAVLVDGGQATTYSRDKDYTLFVHGWNMRERDRVSFASTAYKRLYWQGYRGTLGLYSWPTQVTDNPLTDPGNFNRSEEIAWNSAAGLGSLLGTKQSIRSEGKLTVFGHSMGGIVVSEALALAGNSNIVDTTILTQAAVSSEFYQSGNPATPYYSAFAGEVGGANPRFAHINRATTKLVNFNNEQDYAVGIPNIPFTGLVTGAWLINNSGKPGGPKHRSPSSPSNAILLPIQPGFLGATYDVVAGSPATVTRTVPGSPPVVLQMGFDTYEMFAHGLYTDSVAIGGVSAAPGPFTSQVDLPTLGFSSSRIDHSGQFNHSNIEMKSYWARFLLEAGL